MPQVYILLVAASVAAPLLLFFILAWDGIERRLDLAAQEGRVRERIMRVRGVPTPILALVGRAPVRAVRRRGQTVA